MTVTDLRTNNTRWTPLSDWPSAHHSFDGALAATPHVAAADLLRRVRHAARDLLKSEDAVPATGEAALGALALIGRLVFDDAPTPQVVSDGEGGVEVHWLVNRKQVSAAFLTDGSWTVWVTDEADRQVYAYDSAPREAVPQRVVDVCSAHLRAMSSAVRRRAAG